MKKTITALCLTIVASASVQAQSEARLLRFPTTDGKQIVFSYGGDLFSVPINGGEAKRLTSHVGYEMFPRFSPDGNTIAFTGQYDGNTEVYTIPATGGEPLRLTYTATNSRDDLGDRMGPNNIVMTWTPDGNKIVYRNRISTSFDGKLKTVDKAGGLSKDIPLPEGGFCSFSPDGKQLAYNRVMREFRTWKHYKGGMADDIWIYSPANKSVRNITSNEAQDIIPMWIGDEIFFISDRDYTMNLFVYNTKTGKTDKVTNFTDFDIKFPSHHGNTIVFENGGYIYKLDADTKKAEKVNIALTSDNVYARSERKNGSEYVRAVSLSPNGERLAITTRGEVFSVPVSKGVTKNITRSAGAHDRNAKWSPDGKNIAYISDASGETELWMQPVNGDKPVQLTKNNDTYIRNFNWSPDSKTIIYSDRKNRLVAVDPATKSKRTLLTDPAGEIRTYSFSPDSKWIAYTRQAKNNFSIIYVYNLVTGKEYPVTDKWYSSSNPVFSTDGKYLLFSSSRDFNPIYGSKEWNHVYRGGSGLYIALLDAATPSPFLGKDAEGIAAPQAAAKKDAAEPTAADVVITPEGLTDRIVRVPVTFGYGNVYSDGKKVWYSKGRDTYAYDLERGDDKLVAQGAHMSVQPGAKKAVFRKGNNIYVAPLSGDKVNLSQPVDLSHMVIVTDPTAEWQQIFNEAWRGYRDGFYLENMHGHDWNAIKAKYEAFLPYVKTRLDLNYILGEMISELNCGHAYINPGETERAKKVDMGLLGAEFSRDKSGFFKIEKILPGASWSKDLRSPLADPGINVAEGEFITAIDGVPTNTVGDIFSLLVGKADVPTEISVNSTASAAGSRKIVVTPIATEYPLYHYQWVQNNIKKVEKASGGRIGYIYIPDMGVEGLNEFARYFYPQLDKEGLIVDDRANGGGNVSPMILERLAREAYRVTMSRGSDRIGTVPNATLTGPKVCLINKYSASDGDLFPWGFRAIGLGELIGTRTWGGIVGISGSLPFMDGSDMRVPFFTSFDPKTGDWIIENHGVDPDILIDNDPVREYLGEDQQLDKAIEVVMKKLETRKGLPEKAPAPRNWAK